MSSCGWGSLSASGTVTSGSAGVIDWTARAQVWIASTTADWLLRTVFRNSSWTCSPAVWGLVMIPPQGYFANYTKHMIDLSSPGAVPARRKYEPGKRSRKTPGGYFLAFKQT